MKIRLLSTVAVCATLGLFGSAVAEDAAGTAPVVTATTPATTTAEPVVTVAVAPSTAPVPTEPDRMDQVVCKSARPATGTNLGGRRICATRREWDAVATEAQRSLRDRQMAPVANQGVKGNSP